MEGWIRELRLAVRSLVRRPGFSVVAVGTLALGIGANTAIFSVIEGSLLRPLPYPEPDRLVWLSDGHENFGGPGTDQSVPNLVDLRAGSRLLGASAIISSQNGNLATSERPERVRVLRTSSDLLSVLRVPPRIGRDFVAEDDLAGASPVVILTDEVWRGRFGADPDIVGRMTTVDAEPVEVIGVTPPGFFFPGSPEILMPIHHVGAELPRGRRTYNAVGRLADEAEIAGLRVELQGIFDRLVEQYPEPNDGWFTWAAPFTEMATGRNRRSLLLLAGGVAMVLLIACVNVANLLIVRAESRQREFAVRYALGAGRAGLLPHFLSEGLILSLLGGALGMAAATWGVRVLVALYGGSLQRADQIAVNGTALGFGVLVSLCVGLAVGLLPLIRIGSGALHGALKDGARGASTRGSRLGPSLVIAEVALAVLVVSGAALLINSVWRLQQVELGVADEDRVLTFQMALPEAKYGETPELDAFYDGLLDDLWRLPGVEAVGLVNRLPLLGGYNVTDFPVFGDPERVAHFVSIRSVTPGYFDAVGLPLVSGRWLDATDFEDESWNSVLINETLARQLFGSEDPLGQLVGPEWTEGGMRVVGVVGNIPGGNPTRPPPPAFYFPRAVDPNRNMSAVLKTSGDPLALLPAVRQAVARRDAEIPIFRAQTLEDIARNRLGTRRFAMSLFGVFSGLALLLGAIGIYGVMSYSVAQRSRELGVRLALGASRTSVLRLIMGQGARLTLPGVVIGLLLALASARVLGGLLYEVSAVDPMTYAVVTIVLTGVAMLATCVPAYRATRVDPMASIRSE